MPTAPSEQVEGFPPDRSAAMVKTKVENLAGEEIFTGERDEKLDPVRGRIAILLTGLVAFALLLHAGLTFWASWGEGRCGEKRGRGL